VPGHLVGNARPSSIRPRPPWTDGSTGRWATP